jgi:RIO kinase 1
VATRHVAPKSTRSLRKRSFRQAVDYTENRKTKNTRQARAMAKGTRFGRKAQESAWQSAEVDALFRLAAAGVRVPKPYIFHEGVLLMELVADEQGEAAPRLNDLELTPDEARAYHRATDPGGRADALRRCRARRLERIQHPGRQRRTRDHRSASGRSMRPATITRRLFSSATWSICAITLAVTPPSCCSPNYGKEIWALYEAGALQPDTPLTGRFERIEKPWISTA